MGENRMSEPTEIVAESPLGGSFSNARWGNAERTRIDMDLEHPRHGWIPITINPTEYPELWAEVVRINDIGPFYPPADVDREALIQAARENTHLSRREFCLVLHAFGILNDDEVLTAAKGDFPPSFIPLLDVIEQFGITRTQARVTWATATRIDRLDPFFEIVRQYHQMTPEQADAMFGINVP